MLRCIAAEQFENVPVLFSAATDLPNKGGSL
jgi:hypothetical protein